jgi:hypothetical protein
MGGAVGRLGGGKELRAKLDARDDRVIATAGTP